jgi:septal ring-binding cell division protein DamX
VTTGSKSAARKKGASRNRHQPAAARNRNAPGWLWLLLGLAVGIFAAFLWYLFELHGTKHHAPSSPAAISNDSSGKSASGDTGSGRNGDNDKNDKPANAAPSAANGKGEEPRFDFYTLLPNPKVLPGKKSGASVVSPASPSTTSTSATPSDKSAAPQTAYVLQSGSFKSEDEADQRRAAILMLGLSVKVVKVQAKNETWFRVVTGPFYGKDAAQSARATLRSNGIDSLMAKG